MTARSMQACQGSVDEGAARGDGVGEDVEHGPAERGGGARHVVVLRLGVDHARRRARASLTRDRLAVDLDRDHLAVQGVLADAAARAGRSSEVCRKISARTAAARSAATSTLRVCAGRPFFIRIGVSQASDAPAPRAAPRSRRARPAGRGRRRWSRAAAGGVAGAVAGRARGGLADEQPQHVRVRRRGRGRRRRRRSRSTVIGGCGPYAVARRGEQRGPGRACTAPWRARPGRRTTGRRAAARRRPAAGTGSSPCAPRTVPEPTATGETTTSVEPEVHEPGADPDHVGDRVEGADLVEVHVVAGRGRAPRPRRPASRSKARSARSRTSSSSAAAVSSARTSRQVRWWRRVGDLDVHAGRGEAAAGHPLDAQRRPARARPRRPRPASTSTGTPAPTSAPSSMSPLAPEEASTQPITPSERLCSARRGVAGHPRGEDAGAEAVVDVDHGHPGRAGVEHRQQRGHAAEGRAVPDAGGDRDERHAGQPADDARAARPPCRRRRPGSRPRRAGPANAEQPVQAGDADVVDPVDAGAVHAAVSAASAATGASEVPAADDGDRAARPWAAGRG